jgi:hypothetical protein
MGRAPPDRPVATAVQKKQFSALPTIVWICLTASAPRRCSVFFSGWLALIESMARSSP